MFGCWSSLRREISLMAVLGTPSSRESSLIFFMATISPVLLFLAEQRIKFIWDEMVQLSYLYRQVHMSPLQSSQALRSHPS